MTLVFNFRVTHTDLKGEHILSTRRTKCSCQKRMCPIWHVSSVIHIAQAPQNHVSLSARCTASSHYFLNNSDVKHIVNI